VDVDNAAPDRIAFSVTWGDQSISFNGQQNFSTMADRLASVKGHFPFFLS
jgi:hypothetical protein